MTLQLRLDTSILLILPDNSNIVALGAPETEPSMQASGDIHLGMTVETYRLLSVLGTGSMSVVYLAQRLDDVRVLVAVKLLYSQTVSTPEDWAAIRMRFQREARAASKLRNENILPVLSSGDVNGVPYMVLPVIVGGTLATRLANHPQPMPLGEIARYLTQLANAIDYAHEQGVVHRDIKPSNILLDEHGHVYLTDFGIARLFDSGDNALTRESAQTLTRTGQVLGTPYYMAPEQIKGRPIGPACDIYALGVVLYQLVTGQVPFHGDTPLAVALQHLQEPPSPPGLMRSELPAPVEAVILRALAKDPEDRYATATELAVAFEAGL
ncbi:MAG: serine/threonine-protein kinase, partial [Ktedonobacterales bacterium]